MAPSDQPLIAAIGTTPESMARYLITQEVLSGIEPLSSFPSDKFLSLVSEIDRALPVGLSIEEDICTFLASSDIVSPHSVDKDKLAEAMVGVHYLRLSPFSDGELLEEVRRAWTHWGKKGESAEILIANIQTLLNSSVLHASVKALSLIGDHDKLFISSRILTDIRPVFDDDVLNATLACLVTHTLKLSIRVDGRPQNIFVAADSEDLIQLRETIDRALDKGKTLADVIRSSISGRMGPVIQYTVEDVEGENE